MFPAYASSSRPSQPRNEQDPQIRTFPSKNKHHDDDGNSAQLSKKEQQRMLEERKKKEIEQKRQQLKMFDNISMEELIADEDSDDEDVVFLSSSSNTKATNKFNEDNRPSTSKEDDSRTYLKEESKKEMKDEYDRDSDRKRKKMKKKHRHRSSSPESKFHRKRKHKRRRSSSSSDDSRNEKSKKENNRPLDTKFSFLSSSDTRPENYMLWAYKYDGENTLFDKMPTRERCKCREISFSSVMGGDDYPVYLNYFPKVNKSIEKKERIHQVKFNPKKLEKKFETDISPLGDFVPLSKEKFEEFRFTHEIEKEQTDLEKKEEEMSEERRKALKRGEEPDDRRIRISAEIAKNPKNLDGYIKLLEVEDEIFQLNREAGLQSADKSATNDRKIAILDKAIKNCPRAIEPFLLKISILGELRTPDAIKSEWDLVLNRFVNSCAMWEKYLDSIQHSTYYNAKALEKAFSLCLEKLTGLLEGTIRSHQPEPGTEEFMLKIYIRRLKWYLETGHYEKAIASVQANIEFFVLTNKMDQAYKSLPAAQKLFKFREFYQSGNPRFGDYGWTQIGGFERYLGMIPTNSTEDRKVLTALQNLESDAYAMKRDNLYKETKKLQMTKFQKQVWLERELAEITTMPLRTVPGDDEVDDTILDRFVPWDDLSFHRPLFSGQKREDNILAILSIFGAQTPRNVASYPPTFIIARRFGIQDPLPSFPTGILDFAVRSLWQLANRFESPKFGFALLETIGNVVEFSKGNAKKKEFMIKDLGSKITSNSSREKFDEPPLTIFSSEKSPYRQAVLFSSMKNLAKSTWQKRDKSLNIISKAIRMFIITRKDKFSNILDLEYHDQVIYLSLLVLACQQMSSSEEIVKNLINWILFKDTKIESGLAADVINARQILLSLSSQRNKESGDLYLDCLFPKQSCIPALLIYLKYATRIKEGEKWLEESRRMLFNPPDEIGHRALIDILQIQWKIHHSHRSDLLDELKVHGEKFPNSLDGLSLFINLNDRQSVFSSWKRTNFIKAMEPPPSDPTNTVKLSRILASFAAALKVSMKNSEHGTDDNVARLCQEEAQRIHEPYIWRLAMAISSSEKLASEVHTRASAQCRYSRELHLDRINNSQDDRDSLHTILLMEEQNVRQFVDVVVFDFENREEENEAEQMEVQ